MTAWTNRIKIRMKELDMTQEVLARKLGVTRGAVTHYLAGRRVPPLRQFQKLAAVLKVDPAWLQFGTSEESKRNIKKTTEKEKLEPIQNRIPILSWEQVSEFITAPKMANDIEEFLPHFYTDKTNWYALRVKGDAMTAPLGNIKSFHEGNILIIDPDKNPSHGDYVIALLPFSKEATFKQYVIDGGIRYLKPLNPQYPITQIDESTHMYGVVINCISNFTL
jgi:SOS-response transcriptional repressor LexA